MSDLDKTQEAVEFLRLADQADSENRQMAIDDLKFRYGEQWPAYAIQSRGLERPQLTINEVDSYVRQICNMQRQQRPRGRAHPVDDKGDIKLAKIITGLGRHIEVSSDADYAYDTAFDYAVTMGWGYWRLRTDYIREDSFDQTIFIDAIDNPFTVYFDPCSTSPDGSDQMRSLISDVMKKSEFEKEYPGAAVEGFTGRGAGDTTAEWITKETIRVAEFFKIDRQRAKLVLLSDGQLLWADQLPAPEVMASVGITVRGERDSFKRIVKWCKQTAIEVLEEKVIPGRFIPIVPVYGAVVTVDGRRDKMGIVRFAKDPQRMINFWQTTITESIALAPKAKWLIAEGQDEGHEKEFSQSNLSVTATLRYKPTDANGQPLPPPQRIQPEPPPAGAMEAAFMSSTNLQKVIGMFDPAVRGQQTKSGKAILAERQQAENSTFHFYDNLTRSIKHTWRIMLGWYPFVYDTERVQRIIGDDGKPELITINERTQAVPDGETQAIEKVLNCVCVGEYDVVMETGPGYDTKRQEGVAAMLELMGTPIGKIVAEVGPDIMVRQMDAPGMEQLADRLAAANPLAKIDDKSEVPPQAQMMIANLQKQLEEAQGIINQQGMEIKFRGGIEQMRQEGETKRKLMDVTAKAHDTEQRNASMQHSTEAKALTAQNVAEIQGLVKLLSDKLNGVQEFERQVRKMDYEQEMKHAEAPGTGATVN